MTASSPRADYAYLRKFILRERAAWFRYGQKNPLQREAKVAECDRVLEALPQLKMPSAQTVTSYRIVAHFLTEQRKIREAKRRHSANYVWWSEKLNEAKRAEAAFRRLAAGFSPYLATTRAQQGERA